MVWRLTHRVTKHKGSLPQFVNADQDAHFHGQFVCVEGISLQTFPKDPDRFKKMETARLCPLHLANVPNSNIHLILIHGAKTGNISTNK